MLTAQRQGKTSFYLGHMGEEAVSAPSAARSNPAT
jgi:TPP-dependent pyruvate/acetoin dehydrogenase alpha subunit